MSTPSSNTSSTAGPGGVAPPDGYTTDTGQMSGAARTVTDAAEDAQAEVKDLHPTELTQADFGTKHGQWHADYSAAIEQLGAGAAAMCANTMSFGGQLSGAGQSYDSTEAGATNTVTSPGSGQ